MFKVSFSCLDLLLHTEALLSILNFFTYSVPSSGLPSIDKTSVQRPQIGDQKTNILKAGTVTIAIPHFLLVA